MSAPSALPPANGSDEPTVLEMLESVVLLITGTVVAVGILAIPYLLVRSVRSIGSRRPAPAPEAVPMLAVDM